MKCPHCTVVISDEWDEYLLETESKRQWICYYMECPSCKELIVKLTRYDDITLTDSVYEFGNEVQVVQALPKGHGRQPCPKEIPDSLREDYQEAALVLADSPKASAALSRRCLQHLLRDTCKVKPSSLHNEIEELLKRSELPSYISKSLDAIRNIGNFAAHPTKSDKSGEILDVEPGEAEWNLDVLEALFDFYFVQPAELEKKKAALNKKLKDAGKPEMK